MLVNRLDIVLKLGDASGSFPYGYLAYGTKARIYIVTNKWKRRRWLWTLSLTCTVTLFLLLKFCYFTFFRGLLIIRSFNILVPVIIYCSASVVQLNLIWRLREHESAINQVYNFVNTFNQICFWRNRRNEREDKYMGQKISLLFLVFGLFILEQLLTSVFFSGVNFSLAAFALQGLPTWFPLKVLVSLVLTASLTHASIVLVTYFSVIVLFSSATPFVLAELKLMSKDPFLHPRVMRRSYRALQLLVGLASECIESFLPLVIVVLMGLSVITNFISIRNRRAGLREPMEDDPDRLHYEHFFFADWKVMDNLKSEILLIYSILFIIVVRLSIGKAAEFVRVSAEALNTWTKSATSDYMVKFLKSCQPIRIRVVGFGYIDNSTVLTLIAIILNYTISTAITL